MSKKLTFLPAHWELLHDFCRVLIFSKLIFFGIVFQKYPQSVIQFGCRSGQPFCWSDFGSNCLQKFSADDTGRVNPITVGNFAFLFNCTPVGRTSDSMMVPT